MLARHVALVLSLSLLAPSGLADGTNCLAGSFCGTVLEDDGVTPIPNITVVAAFVDTLANDDVRIDFADHLATTTDTDGQFEFCFDASPVRQYLVFTSSYRWLNEVYPDAEGILYAQPHGSMFFDGPGSTLKPGIQTHWTDETVDAAPIELFSNFVVDSLGTIAPIDFRLARGVGSDGPLFADMLSGLASNEEAFVLVRTGLFSKSVITDGPDYQTLIRNGYHVAVQSLNGGAEHPAPPWEFDFFGDAAEEGHAMVAAVSAYTSTGVALMGLSQEAVSWYLTLAHGPVAPHPSIRAAYLTAGTGIAYDALYERGAYKQSDGEVLRCAGSFTWPAPAPFFLDDPTDAEWTSRNMLANLPPGYVPVPTLHVAGYFDPFAESQPAVFRALQGMGSDQYLLIAPWSHYLADQSGVLDPEAPVDIDPPLDFFDHFVHGVSNQYDTREAVLYYVHGSPTQRTSPTWPPNPPGAEMVKYNLHRGGQVSPLHPAPAVAGAKLFENNPATPIRTWGGRNVFHEGPIDPLNPADPFTIDCSVANGPFFVGNGIGLLTAQTLANELVYLTDEAPEDREITGIANVHLEVGSVLADLVTTPSEVTWYVRLYDVVDPNPQTASMELISEHAVRCKPQPGEVYYSVDVGITTSFALPAGRRLALVISGSCFPRVERDPETVIQAVLSGPTDGPDPVGSYIELPFLPVQ